MIMVFWSKIAYVIQLLFACLILLIPAGRTGKWRDIVCSAAIFIFLSYLINTIYDLPERGILLFGYWALFLVASFLFSWIWLRGSFMQALYYTAFAAGIQHIAYDIYLIYHIIGGRNSVIDGVIYIAVYALFYRFVATGLSEKGRFVIAPQTAFHIMMMVFLVWFLSVLEVFLAMGTQTALSRILYRISDCICCLYVLWVQISQKKSLELERELSGVKNAWQQQKKQYEMTSETIDTINRKCHDLKHQLRALRTMTDEGQRDSFFDEIEEAIMIYDTAVATGNKALDTVLMEKGLFCQNHNIQWSCMVDGSRLDFMRMEDIYAIFGNALDNAIDATMKVTDPMKRIITVKMITHHQLVVIQIQNYYEEELIFENDLPITKKNRKNHGFGLKSIRYTAEKYHGTMTIQAKNSIFMIQILLPESAESERGWL